MPNACKCADQVQGLGNFFALTPCLLRAHYLHQRKTAFAEAGSVHGSGCMLQAGSWVVRASAKKRSNVLHDV